MVEVWSSEHIMDHKFEKIPQNEKNIHHVILNAAAQNNFVKTKCKYYNLILLKQNVTNFFLDLHIQVFSDISFVKLSLVN